MKILTAIQMRQVEEECAKIGITTDRLMENAGKAVAEEVKKVLGNIEKQPILLLIGPGNNGGDGLVAARYLHDWGTRVTVYICAQRPEDDANLKMVQERGIACVDAVKDVDMSKLDEALSSAIAVIDALFGTGSTRPFRGLLVEILDKVRTAKKKRAKLRIIAIDLPSGLNADTGNVDPACLYADNTITLGFYKPGLFRFPGAARVGKLSVVDIGMPSYLAENMPSEYISSDLVRSLLPERPFDANKGSFGRVLVIGGSINYIGAPYLACSGVIRAGAGLVTLAIASSLQPILATKLAEVTYLPLPEARPGTISIDATRLIQQQLSQYNTLVIGCGLGQSQSTINFIKTLLFKPNIALPKLILDADALNILTRTPKWWELLDSDAILTPHPGEMARLAGVTVEEVQKDRMSIAKEKAKLWHKTIVLKGANTIIAEPSGKYYISLFANPGLASAGTGDVLTGVIGGLAAQGLSLFDAVVCGVYLHAQAGELVKAKLGDAGMLASDLLPMLPMVIKQLKEEPS